MRVLVLGGGVSGLSTAYYLTKKLPPTSIYLWEASERCGGWIRSHRNEKGIIFEQAARTLRPRSEAGANTLALVEELQLSKDVCPVLSSSPAAKKRLIYVNGQLHALPSSIFSLFKKIPPFSKPLITNFLNEYKVPKKQVKDESIHDFISRRFGHEIADYLINPLICGICAGNAKEVSVHFLAGQLFEYEQSYGNISKGLLYNLFTKNKGLPQSSLLDKAKREKWNVYSFKNGLETLPRRLNEYLNSVGILPAVNTQCEKIEFSKNEVIVHNQNSSLKIKHLFSTILSEQLAKLIVDQHPKLSVLLESIKSVNVAVVNLHFKGELIQNPGFGFLVPPQENLPILGVIFDTCSFEQNGDTVLTVMMGGHWFQKYFADFEQDEQFYNVALNYISKILNIHEKPISHKVSILEKCIPQYSIGHKGTVESINNYISTFRLPISICGMSFQGVGVNDVILSAKKSVNNFLKNQQLGNGS